MIRLSEPFPPEDPVKETLIIHYLGRGWLNLYQDDLFSVAPSSLPHRLRHGGRLLLTGCAAINVIEISEFPIFTQDEKYRGEGYG